MNFLPEATAASPLDFLSVTCGFRFAGVGVRWVCIQRFLVPDPNSDISGMTGQHVERCGNLTVADYSAFYPVLEPTEVEIDA